MTTDAEDLRTPTEWEQITGIIVHDADGWDGPDDWDQPIDHQTFMRKVARSTVELPRPTPTWDELIRGTDAPTAPPLLPGNTPRGSHVRRG